jgi:hypothetical protein
MSDHDSAPAHPANADRLVKALTEGRVVAFCGAHLGALAGLPDWPEILLGVAHDAERNVPERRVDIAGCGLAIHHGDMTTAADTLVDVLGGLFPRLLARQVQHQSPVLMDLAAATELVGAPEAAEAEESETFIFNRRDQMSPRWIWPTSAHRLLARLGTQAIVSTSFGRAFEQALFDCQVTMPTVTSSYGNVGAWIGRRPLLVKLLGDIENHVDIAVSREQIQAVVTGDSFRPVAGLVAENTPLFVGFRDGDPDLDVLLNDVAVEWNLSKGLAICPDEATAARFEAAGQATVVVADSGLAGFLAQLAERAALQLSFRLVVDKECAGPWEAPSVGMPLSMELSRFEGSVSFANARVAGKQVEVDLRTSAGVLTALNARAERRDGSLHQLLGRHRVVSFDGWQVRWNHRPESGDFR